MARKLWCDCCQHVTDETDEEKKDWAQITFSAIATGAVFQKDDLCQECVGKLRLLIQNGGK